MALLSTACALLVLGCAFAVLDGTTPTRATFKKCYKGELLRTLYNLSFKKCGSECKLRADCGAANYWRKRKKCELVEAHSMAMLDLVEKGDYCVSVARSDLPEVDGCACTGGNDCASKNDSCEKECRKLTVDNGKVEGNMQNVGAKRKVICDTNFDLEPADTSPVCKANGNWSVVPRCKQLINCSEPDVMANANLDIGDTLEGAVRNYTCDDNYITATGSMNVSVTCTNTGNWSAPSETCLRDCSEPDVMDNATLDTGVTHEGAVRNYTCHDNYITATGSMTISVTCTNTGEWTVPAETCLRNCSEPDVMANATLDIGDTLEGAVRNYTCDDNYITATGSMNVSVVCLDTGEWWTPFHEICLRDCSEPALIYNATLDTGATHEGAVRNYTCHNNYITATGSTNISVTCSNTGQWTTLPEPCLRDCSEPALMENTTLDTGYTHEGAVRNYTCHDNYITATGSMIVSVSCTSPGEWTEPAEICLRNCSEPDVMDNATLDTGATHEGAVRNYTCHDNYITATGSMTVSVTCANTGGWTPGTERCLRSCGDPPVVTHALLVTPGSVHEGSVRTVLCAQYYSVKVNGVIVVGSRYGPITCHSSGEWDSVECVLACQTSHALVRGGHGISDDRYITASSLSSDLTPGSGFGVRDSDYSAWMAGTDDTHQYIQFMHEKTVNEIVTEGSSTGAWVTEYKIHYTTDCSGNFTEYDKIFPGNTDDISTFENEINPAIRARCVRVNPQEWHTRIALRVELYGC